MTRTFKVLSALLSYPTAEIQEAIGHFLPALEKENLVPASVYERMTGLISEYRNGELIDLQERYVLLFDRTRSLSLHLFEHVHGESRDRGQAMVDLQSLYESHGLAIDTTELPDYLPLFLEFLSILPLQRALDLLGEPAHVLAALAERLRKRDSSYAAVFELLGALTAPADPSVTETLLREVDDDPEDLSALDAAWEAETVRFGPETANGTCPRAIPTLNRAKRPTSPGAPTVVQRGTHDD
ncbi:MAG: nitrate reductase molybdenum cofactor assembly chaperone [Gammaproteobacteria bacterium]|nr:nitrate reductase molybdenum cofactor assembly chaperone [Gammaproteobacteria bacterium]